MAPAGPAGAMSYTVVAEDMASDQFR